MKIDRITVIGAGTMGHGIAQVAASAGYSVSLYDVEERIAKQGLARIGANLDAGIARGKVPPEAKAEVLSRLAAVSHLETALDQADLVVEAVPERIELKRNVFAQVEALVDDSTLLATNTSSLRVADIAGRLRRPGRFLGMHFFNPVHIMKLLELVVHEGTTSEALATAREVGTAMGKRTIVVRDSPGFATSRLGLVLGLEAMRMLEQGVASAADIDTAMELGYRHPMGPLRLTDLVGLDVRLEIAEYLHRELGSEAFAPPAILRRLVADGKLGKKTGQGFYVWDDPKV